VVYERSRRTLLITINTASVRSYDNTIRSVTSDFREKRDKSDDGRPKILRGPRRRTMSSFAAQETLTLSSSSRLDCHDVKYRNNNALRDTS